MWSFDPGVPVPSQIRTKSYLTVRRVHGVRSVNASAASFARSLTFRLSPHVADASVSGATPAASALPVVQQHSSWPAVSHFQVVAPRGRRVSVRRHARRKRSACGSTALLLACCCDLSTPTAQYVAFMNLLPGVPVPSQIRQIVVFDRSTRSRRAFGQRVRRQFRQISHFQVVAPRGRRVSVRRHARRDAASPVHRPRQTAVGREQPLRAPHAQHPRPGAPDPVEDPQPRVDRAMALTLERCAGQTLSPEQPVSSQSTPPRGTPAECE